MHTDITEALTCLREGKIILYPTDTVWGIGCDATNEKAVKRIFEIKQRADARSMLTLVDQMGRVQNYVEEVPDLAWQLNELSEKPITIIYPQGKNLAPSLLAEDGSIGIRVCQEPFVKKLIERFKKPIVSSSANISGEATPGIFDEINPAIIQQVDYIVTYRRDDTNSHPPSSIIKLGNAGEIQVIRQ